MESTQVKERERRTALPVEEEKKKEETALTETANAVPVGTDFGDEAGAGMENVRPEERITPFLRMAQGLSPEVNPGKGEYIKGLSMGMMFNTALREPIDGRDGVEFVAFYRHYHYGRWVPRDLGGGFRGAVDPTDALVRATIERMARKHGSSARFRLPRYRDGVWTDEPARLADSNEAVELTETGHLYVLYAVGRVTAETAIPAIVPFTSTSMPVYTGYVSRHDGQKYRQRDGSMRSAPIYAYRWRLSTYQDKNAKGEFFNWKIDLSPPGSFLDALYAKEDPDLFRMAREFYRSAVAGIIKPDETAAAAAAGGDGDDVPF